MAGNIREWRPLPKQKIFLEAEEDEVLYGGAAGGGKTDALIVFCIIRRLKIPNSTGLYLRRSYPELEMSVKGRFQELLEGTGAVWNERTFSWRFPNGSIQYLSYLDNDDAVFRYQSAQFEDIVFDELTTFCLVPETEVLTKSGWKRIDQVQTGELVLSLSPSGEMEFKPVSNVWRFPYKGRLLVADQRRGVAFKVTPNHRLVVTPQAHYHKAHRSWSLVEAKDLPAFAYLPRTGEWKGKRVEWYYPNQPSGRGLGHNANSVERVPMDDWLEFLGWWLAEGCAFEGCGRTPTVDIAQCQPNPKLENLVRRLPWKSRKHERGYRFFSRQLYEELKSLGDAHTKRIPRWVFDLCPEQLQILFDAFVAGDGSVNRHGGIQISVASKGLADDLQELAIRIGRVATVTGPVEVRTTTPSGKPCTSVVYRVHVSAPGRLVTELRKHTLQEEHYEGDVYCLTVPPHHTFLARYKGRTFWSGNSQFQYSFMMARCRTTKPGVKPLIRAATNPIGVGYLWVKEAFVDPAPPGTPFEVPIELPDGRKFKRTRRFIPATVRDNPYLDDSYVTALAQLPERERRAMLDGDWNVLSGGFFSEFDPNVHVVDPFPIPEDWTKFIAYDHGFAKPFSVGWYAVDHEGRIYRYREWYGAARPDVGLRLDVPDIARGIKARTPENERIDYYVADPSIWAKTGLGPSIAEVFLEHGIPFVPGDNNRVQGWAQVHHRLMSRTLFVFRTCEQFLRVIPFLAADNRNPEDLDTRQEDHIADELRYACMSRPIVPKKPEKPKSFIQEYKDRLLARSRSGARSWQFW